MKINVNQLFTTIFSWILIAGIYAMLYSGATKVFNSGGFLDAHMPWLTANWTFLFVLFVASTAGQIWAVVYITIEKRFLTHMYTIDSILDSISAKMTSVKDRSKLLEMIAVDLREDIELDTCSVILPYVSTENEQAQYMLKEAGMEFKPSETFEASNQLISYFSTQNKVIEYVDLPNHLKSYISGLKENTIPKYSILIPVTSEQSLYGLVILGPKSNGQKYTYSDRKMFQSVLHQINLVFEKLTIQEKVKIEQEMKEKAIDVAKDATKYKVFSTLTKQISHEIRNPISGLMLRTENAEAKLATDKQAVDEAYLAEYFKECKQIASRVFNVLDTMLKYGKSSAPEKTKVNLTEIIEAAYALLDTYAKENNVDIQNNITNNHVLKGHKVRLEQVMINVIKNAIEAFTKSSEDRNVTLSAEVSAYEHKESPVKKGIKITITDNGKGIPKENLDHITDPFYTNDKYGGAGIGLSIAHDIIEDHQGHLDIESEVGKGTSMAIYLPLAD